MRQIEEVSFLGSIPKSKVQVSWLLGLRLEDNKGEYATSDVVLVAIWMGEAAVMCLHNRRLTRAEGGKGKGRSRSYQALGLMIRVLLRSRVVW